MRNINLVRWLDSSSNKAKLIYFLCKETKILSHKCKFVTIQTLIFARKRESEEMVFYSKCKTWEGYCNKKRRTEIRFIYNGLHSKYVACIYSLLVKRKFRLAINVTISTRIDSKIVAFEQIIEELRCFSTKKIKYIIIILIYSIYCIYFHSHFLHLPSNQQHIPARLTIAFFFSCFFFILCTFSMWADRMRSAFEHNVWYICACINKIETAEKNLSTNT